MARCVPHTPSRSAYAVVADPGEVHISYARSSGPGGQNVNKRACGALMQSIPRCTRAWTWGHVRRGRCLRASLRRWRSTRYVPLLTQPMYIQATHSLQVASERHRSQAQNVQDALSKVRWHYLCSYTPRSCGWVARGFVAPHHPKSGSMSHSSRSASVNACAARSRCVV